MSNDKCNRVFTFLCLLAPLIYAIVYTSYISRVKHVLEVNDMGIIQPGDNITFHSLTREQARALGLDPNHYPHINRTTIKLNFNHDARGEIYFLVGIKDTFQNLAIARKRDYIYKRVTVYNYRFEKEGGLFPVDTPIVTHDQGISNNALFFEIVGLFVLLSLFCDPNHRL